MDRIYRIFIIFIVVYIGTITTLPASESTYVLGIEKMFDYDSQDFQSPASMRNNIPRFHTLSFLPVSKSDYDTSAIVTPCMTAKRHSEATTSIDSGHILPECLARLYDCDYDEDGDFLLLPISGVAPGSGTLHDAHVQQYRGKTIQRIGGGQTDNLSLKPLETKLNPPGFSTLDATVPGQAAQQMRDAFPTATRLHEASKTVGTSSIERIRKAGFNVIPDPTKKFPSHMRVTHPDGAGGFSGSNLDDLSGAFSNSTGN